MKIAIYGAGGYGQYIYHEIQKNRCAKISVVFWIDNYSKKKKNLMIDQEICELPVYTEERFFLEHKYNEIEGIIVAIDNRKISQQIVVALLLQGYNSIYVALPGGGVPQIPVLNEEGYLSSCIRYYKEIKPTLEEREIVNFLVTDYCNLKCKRCGNFSNLAKENICLDLNQFESYLIQFRRKFKSVSRIQLMGGEPLLNSKLECYISLTRKYFPESRIDIVSNGLLILQMQEKLIDMMVSCNVFFYISQYPPTRKLLGAIIDFLEEKGINYDITAPIVQFEKPLTLKEQDGKKAYIQRFEKDCVCHTIKDGRMGCPVIMTLYDNRDYFDLYIGEDDLECSTIDLMNDNIDGWDILKYCKQPTLLCKFCNPKFEFATWEIGEPKKEEWFSN